MKFGSMLPIRFFLLTGLMVFLFISNNVEAQLACPTCAAGDVIINIASGATYNTAISPTSGKNICITGPVSGTPATLSSTFAFSGTNIVCISGLINITSNISTTPANNPKIIINTGAVITHSGTFDLTGSNNASKTYFYNYGTYTNTSSTFNLNGTELYNSGTLTTSSNLNINSQGSVLTHTNTSTGVINIGGTINIVWGSTSDNITNGGQITANCYTSSGAAGVFSNSSGSSLTITGTDASCGTNAYNNGVTSLNVNGTFHVDNGTADFSTSAPATDLSGARMYVTNFTGASHSFVTTPTCMSIQVKGKFNFNFGITITGIIYVWDLTPTSYGNDQGDKFAGSTIACNVGVLNSTGCGSWPGGGINTTWDTQSQLATNKFIYSATDGGSAYGCPTLPVTFVGFDAFQTANGNQLSWSTSEETNANSFIIERSTDGENFTDVGTVKANGNATVLSNYQYFDKDASSDLVYYRLKEVDMNGNSMYSSIVAVQVKNNDIAVLIENPVKEDIKIQLLTDENNFVSVVNVQGQVLFENIYSGNQLVDIKSSQFAPGVYIVKVTNDTQSSNMKVIIE